MKRFFKLILGLLVTVVILLVAAALVLPMIYDKEDLKQVLATQVQERTGRDLSIDGALDFSVFPWLAVEVSDLSLSNADGFGDEAFAHVGDARVGVALMPLFSKQIVVDKVTLNGLELNLMVNARGQNNWDDLAQGDAQDTPTSPGSERFSSQRIAGLNIRDARIDFQDQKAGTHYRLSDFSAETGALGSGEPVPLGLETQIEDVAAGTRATVALSTIAAIDLVAKQYTLENFELEVQLDSADSGSAGPSILIQAPMLSADLVAQTLKMDSFNAELAGVKAGGALSAIKILDAPAFDGTLRVAAFSPVRLMESLHMEAPSTTDPKALQHALFNTSFAGSSSQIKLSDFELELDQSHLLGNVSISNFERPKINFDLAVDEIDIDRYLAPASAESGQQDVAMPSEELQDQEVKGSLTIAKLHLAGLELTDAEVGIALRNSKLRLHPLTAGFYGGRYSGDIQLDSSGKAPQLSLDESIDSITFQRLVADLVDTESLSGTALGHIRLSGGGATSNEVMRSLDGDLGLTLTEGALEGINIWHQIRSGMARYKGLEPPPPEPNRTVFSRMQVQGTVANGVVTTQELIAELPFLTVRGNGTVDLGQSNIDLGLVATVRNMPELSNDPLSAELKGKSLPFKVSGSLEDPSVSLDFEELLKSEATGLLLDKLGLGSKSAPSEGTEAPADAETDSQQEAASSEDQVKDAAMGALSKMLRGKNKDKDKEKDKEDGNL